ncbi:MAG: hypothetical protein FWG70_09080 [Oscillospiraceae bacterium]|nr:hypothetical protein [Oscillospiraceae bacterium]
MKKRIIAIILTMAMTVTLFTIPASAEKLTAADALAILRHVSGGTQLTAEQRAAAGIGADEKVTTSHALAVLKSVTGSGAATTESSQKSGFAASGYEVKAFDVFHPFKVVTSASPNHFTTGKLKATYRVFKSDENHEAKEGYEWRSINFIMEFSDENYRNYGNSWLGTGIDYYSVDFSEENDLNYRDSTEDKYVINYLGKEYEVETKGAITRNEDISGVRYTEGFYSALVPVGYDGFMLAFFNPGNYAGQDNAPLSQLFDKDTLFFRFA